MSGCVLHYKEEGLLQTISHTSSRVTMYEETTYRSGYFSILYGMITLSLYNDTLNLANFCKPGIFILAILWKICIIIISSCYYYYLINNYLFF